MHKALFGEYLARIVGLSGHDVAEILEEQTASRRRFGDIALAWGLCQPEQVWEAWAEQLAHRTPVADVEALGVDSQASGLMPARLAWRYRAVPLRVIGGRLVVAVEEMTRKRAERRLPALLDMELRFVVARAGQVEALLAEVYPPGRVGVRRRD